MNTFPVMIFSLLIVGVCFVFVFLKMIRTNKLFPLSLKEIRGMGEVRGDGPISWNIVPPLWQRVLAGLAMAGIFGLYIAGDMGGWFAQSRRVAGPLFMTAIYMVWAVSTTLFPRRYTLTSRGLWCSTASLFGNPENPRFKPRRLILWEDVARVSERESEIIILPGYPETRSAYALPRWMWNVFKRVEVRLPQADLETKTRISERIRHYCSDCD